ncbi:hypothetical protein WR164_14860 [Philodulcilactobacillus myokoensis]|uniref:ABC transporter permease n=1 Tax=Philodulcilactobacillus myokoensis TaxID=2929573 RepID=A0A9W6B222_9LACO|nr:hypothetical protein [Philodulcilactobacillus myokoensis]GLB47507.1 hypothetical protein WR164_14860 [Philodulcilactobacillus myokoensis]
MEKISNQKQLMPIVKFTTKRNIKKASYWAAIIWPINLLIIFILFNITNYSKLQFMKLIINNYFIILGISILLMSFVFSNIIGYEIQNDSSSKINEFLWSICDPKIQFTGRLLGIINLVSITIIIYIVYTMIFMQLIPEMGNIIMAIPSFIGLIKLLIMIIIFVEAIGWELLISAHLSIKIKKRNRLSQYLLPLYAYIICCLIIAILKASHNLIFSYLSIFIFPILSQINSCRLLFTNDNLILIIIAIIFQFIMLIKYFYYVKNKYQSQIELN